MKVAIIGAGFSGLSAGYHLAKKNVPVTIFESGDKPGGLAVGFTQPHWKWSLDAYYHHFFTNDEHVLGLAKELGHEIITKRPKASTFLDGGVYQLDSPLSLLTFNKLSFSDRIRTGAVIAFLKITTNWKVLEKTTAKEFLLKWNGKRAWEVLWKPLFEKKFADHFDQIPASWFWARIKKRTTELAYPKGGFLSLALSLENVIKRYNGKLLYKQPVDAVYKKDNIYELRSKGKTYQFDKVICTLPSAQFLKITKDLPDKYVKDLSELRGIGSMNIILSLKNKFLTDDTYWLNVNSSHFPFVAVVEHTNFMDKKFYNDEHLVYVVNYLPMKHEYFRRNAAELIREFLPFLKTINPKLNKDWLNTAYLFKTPFAQPVVLKNYSEKIPEFKTPLKDLYLCNIQQVYPWDRGINYAVENGIKVADMILDSK